jgi:predicted NUDIX family NTP pyrophosphohydrolase
VSGARDVHRGMQDYGADDRLLGTVDAVDEEGILVDGRRIPAGMVAGVSGDRVRVAYTASQVARQGAAAGRPGEVASDDPAGAGDMAELLEDDRDDKPVKS